LSNTVDPTILDIDLGNSAMKYRCSSFAGAVVHRADGSVDLTASELLAIDGGVIQRIRASSVLDRARTQRFADEVLERWGVSVEFARSAAAVGDVTNGYADPASLGVDRWLAVLAAYHRFRTAVVVVDLGTAATLDYVDVAGRHLGGYIVPGSHLMQSTLLQDTAAIDIQEPTQPLTEALLPGESTTQAVLRGTLLSLKYLIEGEATSFGAQFPGECVTVLCGGGSQQIAPHLKGEFVVIPDLVLDGLSVALP